MEKKDWVKSIVVVVQVDSKVQAQYEEKLAASLKDLRDAYEQQMAENRYLPYLPT